MSTGIKYVKVIVVDPNGIEYDVEVNPAIGDADLLNELVSNNDLNLDPPTSNYKLRSVNRSSDKRIRENSVIVIDNAKQGNLRNIYRRE